jgi:hypothetical protein
VRKPNVGDITDKGHPRHFLNNLVKEGRLILASVAPKLSVIGSGNANIKSKISRAARSVGG